MKFIDDKETYLKYIYHDCHCVNAGQSPEERRIKYSIAKYLGKSPKWARVLRDYYPNNFARYFGYKSWVDMIKMLKGE